MAAQNGPQPDPEAISGSLFFDRLPPELRLEIYEYAFAAPPPPDIGLLLPTSSLAARARLTCRQFDRESRNIVFRENVHIIQWAHAARFRNPYSARLFALETYVKDNVRHIALRGNSEKILSQLRPLQLTFSSTQRPQRPFQPVRLLTLVLDRPYIHTQIVPAKRKWEEQRLCEEVWAFLHVDEVVVRNIYHRNATRYREEMPGQGWHLLEPEDTVEPER